MDCNHMGMAQNQLRTTGKVLALQKGTRLIVVLQGDALVRVQHDKLHLDIVSPAQPMKLISNPEGCYLDTCAVASTVSPLRSSSVHLLGATCASC